MKITVQVNGIVCPHCGTAFDKDQADDYSPFDSMDVTVTQSAKYTCDGCQKPFEVAIGRHCMVTSSTSNSVKLDHDKLEQFKNAYDAAGTSNSKHVRTKKLPPINPK